MSHSPDDAPIPDARFGDPAPATSPDTSPATARFEDDLHFGDDAARDIADVNAVEVINTVCVHLMSAAAVKVGLAEDEATGGYQDLAEARKLINALAGLVTAAAPEIGNEHARSLRDGLRSLQLAFAEALPFPDGPGEAPGEKFTGRVS